MVGYPLDQGKSHKGKKLYFTQSIRGRATQSSSNYSDAEIKITNSNKRNTYPGVKTETVQLGTEGLEDSVVQVEYRLVLGNVSDQWVRRDHAKPILDLDSKKTSSYIEKPDFYLANG